MSDQDENLMKELADMVQDTYSHAAGIEPNNIAGFTPIRNEFTELTGAYKNDDYKEIVITNRGIMLGKVEDVNTLLTEIVPSYIPGTAESNEFRGIYGDTMINDLYDFENQIQNIRNDYPEYSIVLAGHSRGGAMVLEAGRNSNLETHAFAPISRFNEQTIHKERSQQERRHNPDNINIYYTESDSAPKYLRELEDTYGEKHILIQPKEEILKQEGGLMKSIGMSGHSMFHFTNDPESIEDMDDDNLKQFYINYMVDNDLDTTDVVDEINPEVRDDLYNHRETVRNHVEPIPDRVLKITLSDLYKMFPNISRRKLKEMFNLYDYDGSGFLDENELEMLIDEI